MYVGCTYKLLSARACTMAEAGAAEPATPTETKRRRQRLDYIDEAIRGLHNKDGVHKFGLVPVATYSAAEYYALGRDREYCTLADCEQEDGRWVQWDMCKCLRVRSWQFCKGIPNTGELCSPPTSEMMTILRLGGTLVSPLQARVLEQWMVADYKEHLTDREVRCESRVLTNETITSVLLSSGVVEVWDTYSGVKCEGTMGNLQYPPTPYSKDPRPFAPYRAIYSAHRGYVGLTDSGRLVMWGDCGLLDTVTAAVEAQISDGVVSVAVMCLELKCVIVAVKESGHMVVFGGGVYGTNIADPVVNLTDAMNFGIKAVTMTGRSFAAVRNDGSVVTWGQAGGGGDSSMVELELADGVVRVVATFGAFAAIKENGRVVTWGFPAYGGNAHMHDAALRDVVDVVASRDSFVALTRGGRALVWGYIARRRHDEIRYDEAALAAGVVRVVASLRAFAALKEDGSVVSWGRREFGGALGIEGARAPALEGVTRLISARTGFAALTARGWTAWGDAEAIDKFMNYVRIHRLLSERGKLHSPGWSKLVRAPLNIRL
jgi:hypothetical protein